MAKVGMDKVQKIRIEKIWGYEDWIYSPLPPHQTKLASGVLATKGPLVKVIKAYDRLSVQVHPDDVLAQKLEKQPNGKAECWYVLEAGNEPFVLGLKTYDLTTIKLLVQQDKWEELLNFVCCHPHQFIDVPAGLVHGLPASSKVLEIQQPSDVTYRFFDYRRLKNGKPRELHLEKGFQAIKQKSWHLVPRATQPLTYKNKSGTIIFNNKPFVTPKKGVIINLKSLVAYVCDHNVTVNFTKYVWLPF